MIDRRTLLVGTAAGSLAIGFARAQTSPDWTGLNQEDVEAPTLPPSLQSFADKPSLNGPLTEYQPFGTEPATPEEEKIAKEILAKLPTNCKPIEVALFFLDVAKGKYSEEWRPYTTAWPVRWNPVIRKFFTSTDTTPSGDTTAWCAAFMNFCLIQSAKGRPAVSGAAAEPTYSAASASFRSWGTKQSTPQLGDVVVFRNKSSPFHGHVGFYISDDTSKILTLGGNQFEGTPVRHAINRKKIANDGAVLQFHSYRTDPQLHA